MQVIRAAAMGMCFGVRDALRIVERVAEPEAVTIYGELVHNEQVITNLSRRGFRALPEDDRAALPASPKVLITAHGISHRERRRLLDAGKKLIDTTCPLVRHVHDTALALQRQDYFVLVIGKRNHVEVQGIVGDLDRYEVVPSVAEVRCYEQPRLGVVCQSTTQPAEFRQIKQAIEAKNPDAEIKCVDTICRPTRDRQQAAHELLEQVEALVVVGGKHSNNTRQLVQLAEARGLPVVHVQTAADLDPDWFRPFQVVGLTAGTSTLPSTIEDVHQVLVQLPSEPQP
jgi:4-hydroxy-3-methylbut-2-enyl diphosphate reductase